MLQELIRRDYERLKKRGAFWLTFSTVLAVVLFFGYMEAYKAGWPILMEWCKQRDISKWYIAFFSLYINSVLCFVFYNLGFFIVYALQLPSIE